MISSTDHLFVLLYFLLLLLFFICWLFQILIRNLFQVVSVGMIDATDQHDMIPESVILGGTFRAFSNDSFYQLRQRIEEV